MICGMQQLMCLLAERLAEIFLVERLYVRILVGFPDRKLAVKLVERLHAFLAHCVCRGHRLSAATYAAARTCHDLDEVI